MVCRHPVRLRTAWLLTWSAAVLQLLALPLPPAAQAQRSIPKLEKGCPTGYVDTRNGKCSSIGVMNYTVRPRGGSPCRSGWEDVGGGYCRRK